MSRGNGHGRVPLAGATVAALILIASLPPVAGAAVAWRSEQILDFPRSGDQAGVEDVAVGDVTGDGFADVVAAAQNESAGQKDIVVFPGTGTDAFGSPVTSAIAGNATFAPRSIDLGDLNGDAALDIVVGTVGIEGGASGNLVSLLADGNGGFSSQTTLMAGAIVRQVRFLNANGDALPDIAIGGQVGVFGPPPGIRYDIRVGINGGGGTFSFPNELAFPLNGEVRNNMSVGDLNGGADDIVGTRGNQLHILLSGPGGSYTASTQATSDNLCGASIGDLNSDGFGDLFAGQCTLELTGRADAFSGNGSGVFSALGTVFSDGAVSDAAVGDFDLVADGRQDLMVTNVGTRKDFPTNGRFPSLVNWIRNTAEGLQVRPVTEREVPDAATQAGQGGSIDVGSLNADAVPDFAVASYDGLIVFRSFDDIVPPDTEIVPAAGATASARSADTDPVRGKKKTFSFRANEAGSAFTCKLDKRKARTCRAPYTVRGLRPGRHAFTVTATDLAGNSERKPARVRFTSR